MIATEIPRLSYLTKLNKPAPLSVGLPMPAACCTTLTDVINVHPMMAFGASVRHSVRAERITGIGEATKASAAVTAQRSTSTERIVLVEVSRKTGKCCLHGDHRRVATPQNDKSGMGMYRYVLPVSFSRYVQ